MIIAARVVHVEPGRTADGRDCCTLDVVRTADGGTMTIRNVSGSAVANGDDVDVGTDISQPEPWIARRWRGRRRRPQGNVLRRG
jgi:hypothetical protein